MVIRKAKESDAFSIAKVHVESWKSTYRGIIPDKTLSELSIEERANLWRKSLGDPNNKDIVYVSEDNTEKIIGFASGGPNRHNYNNYKGELSAIYLLSQYQRKGIGYQLMMAIVKELSKKNINSMMVWVLADNPSKYFYENLGGKLIKTENIQIGNNIFEEIAIGWTNTRNILKF